jgi:hypothetical protein
MLELKNVSSFSIKKHDHDLHLTTRPKNETAGQISETIEHWIRMVHEDTAENHFWLHEHGSAHTNI